MASPNATTSLSSKDANDQFWIGPKGQVIPWSACLLALELENDGFVLSPGPDPTTLRVRPTVPERELCPEMKHRIRYQKEHLLQIVALL